MTWNRFIFLLSLNIFLKHFIYRFIFFNIILDDGRNLKLIWDLISPKDRVLKRSTPQNIINKEKFKNSDAFLSLVKRTQNPLTPYESVGK